MSCSVNSEQLDSYLDGSADEEFASWFAAHLPECRECRRLHEFHAKLRAMFKREVCREATPDLVRQRLMRVLEEATPGHDARPAMPVTKAAPPSRVKRWWRPIMAAASVAAVSTLALFSIANQPHPTLQAMASDHVRCCGREPDGTQKDPITLARARLGSAPEVAQFPQLCPYDVRLCPIEGHKAVHMLYTDNNRRMVSMFGLPDPGVGSNLPEATSGIHPAMLASNSQNLAAWKRKGWVYSLVSEMPPQQLEKLATQGSYTVSASGLAGSLASPTFGGVVQNASFDSPTGVPLVQPAVWNGR